MTNEVEQEARRDMAQKLTNLSEAEKAHSKALAALTEAQEDADEAERKLERRRGEWADSLALYQAATSIPLDLSTMEGSEPTEGGPRAQEH